MKEDWWIALRKSEDAREMLGKYPKCFLLLTQIALRARRSDEVSFDGLAAGEALIGDHQACGLTRDEYRVALKKLTRWQIIATRTTNRGTIARLLTATIYDHQPPTHPRRNPQQPPSEPPSSGDQVATNLRLSCRQMS